MVSLAASKQPQKPGTQSNLITKIDHTGLVIRLICEPLTQQYGHHMRYFEFKIGDRKYSRPCREAAGVGPNPTFQKYLETIKKMGDMKKRGLNTTEDYKKLNALRELFKPKDKHWYYGFLQGDPVLKAVRVSSLIHDRLWGRKDTSFRKGVTSLIKELQDEGIQAFATSVKEQGKVGWLRMYSTGEKLGTDYHCELCTEKQTADFNGKKITIDVPVEIDMPESFYGDYDESLIPNPLEYESKYVWTEEEELEFVNNPGKVPQRVIDELAKRNAPGDSEEPEEIGMINMAPDSNAPTGSLDEIPF